MTASARRAPPPRPAPIRALMVGVDTAASAVGLAPVPTPVGRLLAELTAAPTPTPLEGPSA